MQGISNNLAAISQHWVDQRVMLWKTCRVPRFGEAIRKLMEENHLTQREFAAKAGISTGTLARVLNMKAAQVNQSTYRAIAASLGLTPTELDRRWRSQGVPQRKGDAAGGIPILSECPAGSGDFDPT